MAKYAQYANIFIFDPFLAGCQCWGIGDVGSSIDCSALDLSELPEVMDHFTTLL